MQPASAPQERKILIVEDDALTRRTLRRVFEKMNYTIFEAENGVSGVEMYRQNRPGVVITDLLMPDKEGLETIHEIRELGTPVKIVAMSGGGSTQNMSFLELSRSFGADFTLTKPFKPAEIVELLKNLQ